jgi:hypothetical protein
LTVLQTNSIMLKTVLRKGAKDFQESRLTKRSIYYQIISCWFIRNLTKYPSKHQYNLTISDSHRFVWYRVAKVGSRTIFDVFERACITLVVNNAYNCHYPVSDYGNYTKFAFVRNPWDRLVSCWLNKVVKVNFYKFSEENWEKMKGFKNFIQYVKGIDVMTCKDPHLRMQCRLIDLNHIDFIGRFETFETDYRKILDMLDIGEIEISNKNASKNRKHFHEYYNDETRQLVAQIYKLDIQIFNYQF